MARRGTAWVSLLTAVLSWYSAGPTQALLPPDFTAQTVTVVQSGLHPMAHQHAPEPPESHHPSSQIRMLKKLAQMHQNPHIAPDDGTLVYSGVESESGSFTHPQHTFQLVKVTAAYPSFVESSVAKDWLRMKDEAALPPTHDPPAAGWIFGSPRLIEAATRLNRPPSFRDIKGGCMSKKCQEGSDIHRM